jgi:hypothetical protein
MKTYNDGGWLYFMDYHFKRAYSDTTFNISIPEQNTEGKFYVDENSLKPLLNAFSNKKIGAVSGNPVSINPKNNLLGYWASVLSNTANERRLKALELGKRFFCSGYLFAIRKELFPKLPEEILSEDGLISHNVYEQGYKISYSKDSKVYIK